MKKLIILSVTLLALFGCTTKNKNDNENPAPKTVSTTTFEKNPVATIQLEAEDGTDLGIMEFELMINDAPQSVYNFISLANSGFYDGLTMHRLAKDFVLQGGDPLGTGAGGPGYSIFGEFSKNGFDNPIKQTQGTIAWARANDYDSAGSQFYIVLGEFQSDTLSRMNSDYAGFGHITTGLNNLLNINDQFASSTDQPKQKIIIKSVKVETFNQDIPQPTKLNSK